jgi:isoleucyl-tRNA synthetase
MQDAEESVHLSKWPSFDQADQSVLASMVSVRQAVNDGLAERAKAGIKVRQPLASATISSPNSISRDLEQIIAEELNTKKIVVKSADELSVVLDTNITQSLKNEGLARDIVRNIQQARKDSGLEVENYIKLSLKSENIIINDAINQCEKLIQNEVLATTLLTSGDNYEYIKEVKIEGEDLLISLEKDDLPK